MTKFTCYSPMAEPEQAEPSEWKRPDQVMQLHRLKMRKRALQARIRGSTTAGPSSTETTSPECTPSQTGQKRKNPFAREDVNKKVKDVPTPDLEVSSDSVLFELFHIDVPKVDKTFGTTPNVQLSFASVLSKLDSGDAITEPKAPKGSEYIPIDWTLKTKMRFMSPKPFAWNVKLKTSEEASGTTGFVRCLDIGERKTTLDTSPNARFHQCCLVWQHPSIPWLELFPRSGGRVSASLASNLVLSNNQFVKDALYQEWSESFRSLFHLVRARQCPYFYVCANAFTVLFRAAGICGLSEVHALLTPTTRGFRQMLKQEDIEYSMPLRTDSKRRSDTTDSGCDTLDLSNATAPFNHLDEQREGEEEDDEPEEKWLQSIGVEDSEIRRINTINSRLALDKESEIDNMKQSLVFVKGVEAQALFNFLINCKSATSTTGALAGVPPTLLSPVAFHGATLKPLKVKESVVLVDKDRYHSLELKGPLLPHVMPSLCRLMESSQLEKFSLSCAQLSSTSSFTSAKHGHDEQPESRDEDKLLQSVFGQENLSDCGFTSDLLVHFCNPDPNRIQVVESLKFSTEGYTWT
ncbi:protein downstream neighbor of son homolog [Orussus abietinus]|uniref:protein downstream neighbor of son homolog n=1 Tax=Orussus abietinus TaxID=222816 RepID=UPI0006269FF1|nr:protein downstream neighbor of son homolog [Orussus abietinus]XP_012273263.1 protein downstream neighbor of son homolog [Orussus abietinus]